MSVEFTAHFNLVQYTLGVKIQNMKMDFDTGAHGVRDSQWTLMMNIYVFI